MDAVNFAAEMAKILTDAAERLQATAFITGTGVGQPTGIVTAAKTVADTLVIGDLYKTKRTLPVRWRPTPGGW